MPESGGRPAQRTAHRLHSNVRSSEGRYRSSRASSCGQLDLLRGAPAIADLDIDVELGAAWDLFPIRPRDAGHLAPDDGQREIDTLRPDLKDDRVVDRKEGVAPILLSEDLVQAARR